MLNFLKKAKQEMMDLAQFNAADAAFIRSVEDQTAKAMKISDPIDRYLALENIVDKRSVWDHTETREDQIEDILDAARNKVNKKIISPSIPVSIALSLLLFCELFVYSPVAAGVSFMGAMIGSIIGQLRLESAIMRGVWRACYDAKEKLKDVKDKLYRACDPVFDERNRLLTAYPPVKEYDYFKKHTPLTDNEIRARVNEKFRPKLVTPDDLTVTLPESGAVKPSIKLKKG